MAAIRAGADALGFVFYAPSPRAVTLEQAAEIISALPPFVTTTALFVDADRVFIEEILAGTSVDLLQFHGAESEVFCASFSRPYIKALRMRPDIDLISSVRAYPSARAILLDAYTPGIPGGTGARFDWSRIPRQLASQIILAGGLEVDNIAEAVRTVQPFAVDVSGGVEASRGIKDAAKIEQFIGEVNRVNDR